MDLISEIIKKSAAMLGLEKTLEVGLLIAKWQEVVGEKVAAHTKPASFRKTTLIVNTRNPVWSHQMAMLKPTIIKKIQDLGIGVEDIRFKTGETPWQSKPVDEEEEMTEEN